MGKRPVPMGSINAGALEIGWAHTLNDRGRLTRSGADGDVPRGAGLGALFGALRYS